MPPILPASRRSLLLQGAGVVIASSLPLRWGAARAQAAALRPTPSQTEGPFYPIALPADLLSAYHLAKAENCSPASPFPSAAT